MGAEGAKMYSEIQKRPYLSGQWTEQSLCDGAIAYHMSLTFTGVFFVYSGFLLYRKYRPKTTKISLLEKEKPQFRMYNLN